MFLLVVCLMNLLAVADYHCGTFILISPDKAVHPSSVMGATKRICELVTLTVPPMECAACPFGLARLGSKGSLIPILQKQLRHNEPLTITHLEMMCFFMTIREAVPGITSFRDRRKGRYACSRYGQTRPNHGASADSDQDLRKKRRRGQNHLHRAARWREAV